jgi:hypothetical protein
MKRRREKKVWLLNRSNSLAWEMLVKKMEKLNLSDAEQELIK